MKIRWAIVAGGYMFKEEKLNSLFLFEMTYIHGFGRKPAYAKIQSLPYCLRIRRAK